MEAKKEFGDKFQFGDVNIVLTNKEIKALCEDKCIATHNDETPIFLTLQRCE